MKLIKYTEKYKHRAENTREKIFVKLYKLVSLLFL